MKELTEEHLTKFKQACEEWKRIWGLTEWTFYYGWQENTGAFASAICNGNVATMKLSHSLEDDDYISFDAERLACHEVAHIVLGRLGSLASSRHVSSDELEDVIESTTTRIANVVMGLMKLEELGPSIVYTNPTATKNWEQIPPL